MDNARSPMLRGSTDRTLVIELITSTARGHPPQLPESAIVDLKREAEEDFSLESMNFMIKRSQRQWRYISYWRKDSMSLNSGWKKGRLFNIHIDTFLMTPTNMSSVSWLDLAEYTLDCARNFRTGRHIQFTLRSTSELPRIVDIYHIETGPPDWSAEFKLFTKDYMKRIEDSMRCEMMYGAAAALSRRWDTERFVRYTNSVEYMFRVDREFHLRIFPRLLVEHCNDSTAVVGYFMLMNSDHRRATIKPVEYIVKHMSLPCLHFFMLHLKNALRVHRQQERFMCWITLHLGLIKTAFRTGQNETLELLLGFGWPYEFCFNLYEDSPVSRLNWPRKTEEFSAKSLISPAFTAVLILYLINNSSAISTTIPIIAQGVRLFWRSLPTPFVSLYDLQRLVHMMAKGEYDLQLIVTMHGKAKWAREFISYFPRDCLAAYQPRSLLHLTRCKIRETIDMMVNVKFLPLPNNLKEYLWLKW